MSLLGWKSIKMQVAFPRTQDAGKLQEQIGKQHQHFQESFTANQEQKRKRPFSDVRTAPWGYGTVVPRPTVKIGHARWISVAVQSGGFN
ncbi:hypothetical protein ACDX78_10770 [Virgibacillus oceani]